MRPKPEMIALVPAIRRRVIITSKIVRSMTVFRISIAATMPMPGRISAHIAPNTNCEHKGNQKLY
jgi:hypothetical protein